MDHNERPNFPSARVLLVDDDRRLLAALSTRLGQIGCHCTACSNASEAMVQFAAASFDLVITDMTMPGIDGLSIVALLRSQRGIPILVLTGHSHEYGPLIAGYPNVTVVRKPFEWPALMACVRSLLSQELVPGIQAKCG
jgi:DNA-binding response OmpR family regulator